MSAERSIPHLRDIFGLSINQKTSDPSIYDHQHSTNGDIDKPNKKSKKSSSSKSSANGQNGGGELKTLERHLSMKKTIRKKIMRDLQQAFVDDPNEFKVDNNQDRLKSELNLEAMRYGESKHHTRKSDNFLDMLRGGDPANYNNNSNINNSHLGIQPTPYRHGGEENFNHNHPLHPVIHPTQGSNNEKQSFWSRFGIRNKNKR